ncbi:MAG: DUF507 family protein [Candidatus Schekmanbacteria bacterium]|nr:DUF507 family protein [Candidatus Schekmanbacteria bacterium]
MKLRQREIEIVSRHLVETLSEGEFIQADDKELLALNIAQVIHNDLAVEDNLNEEVRQILSGHSTDIEKSHVEYHRVFNMVKTKLAKERNLIL